MQVDPDTMKTKLWYSVILSPLCPASLTHKNSEKTQNNLWHASHRTQITMDRFKFFSCEDSENIQYYIFNSTRYGFLPGPSFSKHG